MRVIVAGSRNWFDIDSMTTALADFPAGTTIVVGTLPGAERMAAKLADELSFELETWDLPGEDNPKNVMLRNHDMADSDIDSCIGFFNSTSEFEFDLVKKCRSLKIETTLVK
jgi:hypothetical protein